MLEIRVQNTSKRWSKKLNLSLFDFKQALVEFGQKDTHTISFIKRHIEPSDIKIPLKQRFVSFKFITRRQSRPPTMWVVNLE